MEEKPLQPQNEAPAQPSGIFEPKPQMQAVGIKSGKRKAMELAIAVVAVIAVVIVVAVCKNLYLKPIRGYYKGLSKDSVDKMCDAFPAWLVNAQLDAESVTVYDMCTMVTSTAKLGYGEHFKAKAKLVTYEEKDDNQLETIENGIFSTYHQKVSVTEGRVLTLSVTYKYGDGKQNVVNEYVTLYKMNGRWVMIDVPSGKK